MPASPRRPRFTPEVRTNEYCAAHGRPPRGVGSWAFQFGLGDVEPVFCPGSVTYGEARRWAVSQARERGASVVRVCS